MTLENAVKGLAILTAIPVVMLAIWADYFGQALEQLARENPHYDRATELYKIRLAGLCAIFFQFGIYLGTAAVRNEAPIAANLLFVAGVLAQSLVQASVEHRVRKPAPRLRAVEKPTFENDSSGAVDNDAAAAEPLKEMDLALRGFFWATLGGALYLVGFALPVAVISFAAHLLHASPTVMTFVVITAAILGMICGVGINFALGAFYLRRMLPTRELGGGPLRESLEDCFKSAQVSPPSLWVIETGRRREATAMMAGFPWGGGLFRPGLFLSRGLVEALDPAEVRAVVLHEVSHVKLAHLRRRLAFATVLVVGTTAAATLCVFLTSLLVAGEGPRSFAGFAAAAAAFILTFSELAKQSRAHELEADRHCVEQLGAGLEQVATALQKLDQLNGKTGAAVKPVLFEWIQAHPTTEERIVALRARAGQSAARPGDGESGGGESGNDQSRAA